MKLLVVLVRLRDGPGTNTSTEGEWIEKLLVFDIDFLSRIVGERGDIDAWEEAKGENAWDIDCSNPEKLLLPAGPRRLREPDL